MTQEPSSEREHIRSSECLDCGRLWDEHSDAERGNTPSAEVSPEGLVDHQAGRYCGECDAVHPLSPERMTAMFVDDADESATEAMTRIKAAVEHEYRLSQPSAVSDVGALTDFQHRLVQENIDATNQVLALGKRVAALREALGPRSTDLPRGIHACWATQRLDAANRLLANSDSIAQDHDRRIVERVAGRDRLIRASENILDVFGTRTERGDKITAEWGEPDEFGVYTPVFTVHADDNLVEPFRRLVESIRWMPIASEDDDELDEFAVADPDAYREALEILASIDSKDSAQEPGKP